MHADLRSFIDLLRREGELVEITAEADPYLEIAEIHRRVIEAEGKALFFRNVRGSSFPVVTNLFGTPRRIELAFGDEPLKFVKRMVEAAETMLPPTLDKLWGFRDLGKKAMRLGTRKVSRPPVAEAVMKSVDLEALPFLQLWPEDGGHFATLPLVYTESPADAKHNLGIYRLHRFDADRTGMHWQIGKGGGFHYFEAEARGEALPVNVYFGGPPALMLSAIAPLPEGVPELMLASLLNGMKIDVAQDPRGDERYRLLANAEFALTGRVEPFDRHPEGPFGDHYGYYSLEHDYPIFTVDRIYHRRDAIYPATVVGKPKQEDYFIGDYLQELLSPLFPLVMPAVRDLWSYGQTGFHSLAAAVVHERYAREALSAGFRILGEGQLTLTKFLLLTDRPQDLKDFRSLLEYILARADWREDLQILGGTAFDTLDYASGKINFGSKAILLGVGEPKRELAADYSGELPMGVSSARPFCKGCLVIECPPFESEPDLAERLVASNAFSEWQVVVIHDDASVAESMDKFLWATWTRFDPDRDIKAKKAISGNHISYEAPIFIDARMKPWYPKEVEPLEETVRLVDSRWGEYF